MSEPTWWRVTINDTETVAIEATDAARAATLAGDRWRAKHSGGVDRGGIETVHVRRDADYV